MQYADTPARPRTPTLVLVHGYWHTGRCWSAVQAHLAAANVDSIAPTLPGHSGQTGEDQVIHADYVETVLETLDPRTGTVVLVGHSFGGNVIGRVTELRPERCHGLIYYSAFVPRDGERVADSLPAHFIEFLDQAASSSAHGTIALPDDLLRDAFANTADERTLARIRSLLVPEPHAPIFERLSLPRFAALEIPAGYITCRDDRTLPPGTFHPGQSSRLRHPELIEIEGDHEALLTAPERLTDALLEGPCAFDLARPRYVREASRT